MNQVVLGLVHAAMPAITAYREAARERWHACEAMDRAFWKVGSGLGQHASERYQSATVLIQLGRLWDADILLRSAAEAVFKILFIAQVEGSERSRRIREFELLSRAADLRQSERARHMLAGLPPDSPERSVFAALVLPDAQEAQIRAELPRKVRQALNAKWSFSEIVEWLHSKAAEEGLPPVTRMILHTYGLSSHVLHADERGLAIVHDRLVRSDEERSKLENAHAARLLGDIIAFYALTVIAFEKVVKAGSTESIQQARAHQQAFDGHARAVAMSFYESQAPLYDAMGLPYPAPEHPKG